MPRKTDGIVFELHPGAKKGEDGKPLQYARPKITVTYDTKGLDEYCTKYYYSASKQVQNILNLASEAVASLVKQGYRVETPFGSFAPKLKVLGDHTDPNKVTGKDIVYDGIEFIPTKAFKKACDCSRHGFRKEDSRIVKAKRAETEEERQKALRESFYEGYTTVKRFMNKSGLGETTARAYLENLCKGDTPLLRRYREGTTKHYRLIQPSTPDKKQELGGR